MLYGSSMHQYLVLVWEGLMSMHGCAGCEELQRIFWIHGERG